MGGKQKQAQRTKNNTRPSSSGRSAELLGTSVRFVGFSALQDGGFVPVLPSGFSAPGKEPDSTLNPAFQLVLKKMNKKDVTTKIKALQEFTDLCRDTNAEELRAIVPFWPRLYCQLALDADHRVREAAHQAQRRLALSARRNLAPHLKSIAGVWFTSQADPYPPAATAATVAFQDAFPPPKIAEAIAFCQEEILLYINDNIFNQTSQTLCDPKMTSPEDMESKFFRVLTCSLEGYQLLLNKLPQPEIEKCIETHRKMLSNPKFWKLPKTESIMVKQAWFSAVNRACGALPAVINEMDSKAVPIVMGFLDESDPAVLPLVWETSLHLILIVENWWSHVNGQKMFLPKLWRVLKGGGFGCATKVFPCLLPLLSKLPPDFVGNPQEFYPRFFSNLKEGLNQKTVMRSGMESTAVVKAFMECLSYVLKMHHQDQKMCEDLILLQLLPVIEASLTIPRSELPETSLYADLSRIVTGWEDSETVQAEDSSSSTTAVLRFLWKNLSEMCVNLIETSDRNSGNTLENIADLVITLKNPEHFVKKSKKNARVRFSMSQADEKESAHVTKDIVKRTKSDSCTSVKNIEDLTNFAKDLLVVGLRKADDLHSGVHVTFVSKLLKSFGSPEVYQFITQSDDKIDGCEIFITKILQPWLYDKDMCSESSISILFSGLMFLNTEKKLLMLKALCEIPNPRAIQWAVGTALGECFDDIAVRQWLRSTELTSVLLQLARRVSIPKEQTEGGDVVDVEDAWNILSCCFSAASDGELIISMEALSGILGVFCEALTSPDAMSDSTSLDSCVNFVADLSGILYSGDLGQNPSLWLNPLSENLLLAMFRLVCEPHSQLQSTTQDKLNSSFLKGTESLMQIQKRTGKSSDEFVKNCCEIVKAVVLYSRHKIDLDTVGCLVDKVMQLWNAIISVLKGGDATRGDYIKVERNIVAALSLSPEQWKEITKDATELCHAGNFVNRIVTYVELPHTAGLVDPSKLDIRCMYISYFLVSLVLRMKEEVKLCESSDESDGDEYGRVERKSSDTLIEVLVEVSHVVTVCKMFMKYYRNKVHLVEISKNLERLYIILKEWFNFLSVEERRRAENLCITYFRNGRQGLWNNTLQVITAKEMLDSSSDKLVCSSDVERIVKENVPVAEEKWTQWKVQLVQTFVPCMQSDWVINNIQSETAKFIEATTLDGQGLGHLAVLTRLLHPSNVDTQNVTEEIQTLVEFLSQWRKHNEDLMLFSCNLSTHTWPEICLIVEMMEFLRVIVKFYPLILMSHHWDFILCTLIYLSETVKKSDIINDLSSHSLAASVCDLTTDVASLVKTLEKGHWNGPKPSGDLETEWNEFFAEKIYSQLTPVFFHCIDALHQQHFQPPTLFALESLCSVVLTQKPEVLSSFHLCSVSVTDEDKSSSPALSDKLLAIVKGLCHGFTCRFVPLQIASCNLFLSLVHQIVSADGNMQAVESNDMSEEITRTLPVSLQSILRETQSVVDTILQDFRIGESCTIQPCTDSYTYTLGNLLTWSIILQMFQVAGSELRCQYAACIRDGNFLSHFLNHVFRLMPPSVLRPLEAKVVTPAPEKWVALFAEEPQLSEYDIFCENALTHLACWLYYQTLQRLPALTRQWWSEADRRTAGLVDKLTARYVSPLLCSEEMRAVQEAEKKFSNMVIKVHPTVREVVATYSIDDSCMELVVTLPQNHPLGPITVESGRRVGVGTGQWRNWMLQLTTFLMHQNGSITDGLTVWKRNVDKRFEGVEECYICFYVLHGSNYQLPKLLCRTCKKKFHSACLYKWFSTSNKSTCPLCRNLF